MTKSSGIIIRPQKHTTCNSTVLSVKESTAYIQSEHNVVQEDFIFRTYHVFKYIQMNVKKQSLNKVSNLWYDNVKFSVSAV